MNKNILWGVLFFTLAFIAGCEDDDEQNRLDALEYRAERHARDRYGDNQHESDESKRKVCHSAENGRDIEDDQQNLCARIHPVHKGFGRVILSECDVSQHV